MSGYHKIIKEATDCPDDAIEEIEEIMRNDVYHSTLDWQTAAELKRGAKLAYGIHKELQRLRWEDGLRPD